MAYEWKFKSRPYSDEEAKKLLANVVSPETTDWHYNTHHKGYVTALNTIEKALETADRATANGNFSQIGELKRRFTWNHSGALLHDLYWEVLGGDGDPSKGPEVKAALEKEFGSFDNYIWQFTGGKTIKNQLTLISEPPARSAVGRRRAPQRPGGSSARRRR